MRRFTVTFWLLVVIAVVATGMLTRALQWSAGPATGTAVATSGLVAVLAMAFAVRILVVTGRGR